MSTFKSCSSFLKNGCRSYSTCRDPCILIIHGDVYMYTTNNQNRDAVTTIKVKAIFSCEIKQNFSQLGIKTDTLNTILPILLGITFYERMNFHILNYSTSMCLYQNFYLSNNFVNSTVQFSHLFITWKESNKLLIINSEPFTPITNN